MKATCSHCHTAGCSRHLRPTAGGVPHLPSCPYLPKWASGCLQFLPPGLLIGWFCCFRYWNYDALLDPQSPGAGGQSSHREQVLCFCIILYLLVLPTRPLPGPLFLCELALQTFVPHARVPSRDRWLLPTLFPRSASFSQSMKAFLFVCVCVKVPWQENMHMILK